MEGYYVGLDVHSRESVFVIKKADRIIARGAIPMTPAGLARLRRRMRFRRARPWDSKQVHRPSSWPVSSRG
jgi:hypothetical protein